MTPTRDEILRRAFDRSENIDIPPSCCDECHETRVLAQVAAERWEKVNVMRRDLELRENTLKGRERVLDIREVRVSQREKAAAQSDGGALGLLLIVLVTALAFLGIGIFAGICISH